MRPARSTRAVKAALVLVRCIEGGSPKRLIAYILENPVRLTPEVLQEHVGETFCRSIWCPQAFVTLEAFPLTVNGKGGPRGAAAAGIVGNVSTQEYVAPRTELEERLAAIWSQVLGLDRVGVHDNFFECGGDSILSIQILSRAKQAGLAADTAGDLRTSHHRRPGERGATREVAEPSTRSNASRAARFR